MGTKLYVGNLSYEVTDGDLKDTFSAAGEVADAKVISDKFSGRSRGFGFVEMASDDGAKTAIEKFNDTDLKGRKIVVNEARPQTEGGGRGPRSGGGGGYGGGGGGGKPRRPGGGGGFRRF